MRTTTTTAATERKSVGSGFGHRFMCPGECRSYQYHDLMIEKGADGDVLRKTCQKCERHVDFVWIAETWIMESMIETLDMFMDSAIEGARERMHVREFVQQYDEAETAALLDHEPETKLQEWVAKQFRSIPAQLKLARMKEKF